LNRAGVRIAFSEGESHLARRIRQLAGNAVAQGLPWVPHWRLSPLHRPRFRCDRVKLSCGIAIRRRLSVDELDPLQ
jgi:hypothetical protein